MNKSSSYERMLDVFAASHRKNKNSIRVLMKSKKESAIIERQTLSTLHLTLLSLHSRTLNLKFFHLSLKIIEAEKYDEKHAFFDANIMFFSSISEVICKSETYLSQTQNLCRKHS